MQYFYPNDFERESRRIDQLIWDAMSLVKGERVLFCGYANDGMWVKRAVEIGVDVSVIESDAGMLAELDSLRIPTLRGSTTMIPARDASFDAIVAFHYLHEIDPTFHTQIVWELARVGKRIIVVEPAPPADALGKRISELYSRAKFEAGAFEEYHPIDYWRKLLAMVKADVLMQQFTFQRVAPRFAVEETVNLILDAMAVEQMPKAYLDELRELARRPNAQLSPLSRFVLVALAAGEPVRASAGTLFRDEEDLPDDLGIIAAKTRAPLTPTMPPAQPAYVPPPPAFADALAGAEFPPVLGPSSAPQPPAPPYAPQQPYAPQSPAPPAFGQPQPPPAPALSPFGQPVAPAAHEPTASPFGQPPQPPAQAPTAPPFGTPPPFAPAAAAPQAQPPFAQPAQPPGTPFGAPPAGAPAFGPPPGPEPAFGMPDTAPFGVPAQPARQAPFGTPFALPEDPDPFGLSPDPEERAGYGWNWEPPENEENPGDKPFGY